MICTKLQACMEGEIKKSPLSQCDNLNRKRCIESSDCRKAIKCEEHKRKYIFENLDRKHVISYHMDGGIIHEDASVPEGINKCDYLLIIQDTEHCAVLVELKGKNVPKSLKQILGTLNLFKSVFHNFEHVYARSIVTSSTPNLKASPEYTNLQRLLRQTYKGNIKIKERQYSEKNTELNFM